MQKRPAKKKRPRDLNRFAFSIVSDATSESDEAVPIDDGKNPAAVALGKLGGQKGGIARAKKLSGTRRRNIAKKAARARWAKRDKAE